MWLSLLWGVKVVLNEKPLDQEHSDTTGAALGSETDQSRHERARIPYGNIAYDYFQWHINPTALFGPSNNETLNVLTAWDDYTGASVKVAVIDDGFESTHADLAAGISLANSRSFSDTYTSIDPSSTSTDNHGTAVMGLIGASFTAGGSVGVAPGATLFGYRIDFSIPTIDFQEDLAAAIMAAGDNADVANMSLTAGAIYSPSPNSIDTAITHATTTGRGGLGTILVQSAGNSRQFQNDTSSDPMNARRETISVAAVDITGSVTDYSSYGANLLVSAFGGNAAYPVVTTDRTGAAGYDILNYSYFLGTSAAAPMVSGIVALMLEANSSLGWRDVQQILAYSARHVGSDVGAALPTGNERFTWAFNGAENWNNGGLHYSNDYGYGLVDATAAVRLAETWTTTSTSANEATATGSYTGPPVVIPDNTTAGITFDITIGTDIIAESISLELGLTHSALIDLEIKITSADGTTSWLIDNVTSFAAAPTSWSFTSETFRGELTAGTWTVTIADTFSGLEGSLDFANLTIYGAAQTLDDTFIYTNEFSVFAGDSTHVLTLTDLDGGVDTINAAAVSGNSTIRLGGDQTCIIGGVTFAIAAGSIIENIYGGDGADILSGNAASNTINGGRGDDTLTDGLGGLDHLVGGDGTDIYIVTSSETVLRDSGFERYDKAKCSAASFSLLGTGVEFLEFTGTGDFVGTLDNLGGVLAGGDGNDTLFGGSGNDSLYGNAGNNILRGGGGSDIYFVDSATDIIRDTGTSGTDSALTSLSAFSLVGTGVERLVYMGNSNFVGRLSSSGGTIISESGNDTLYGSVKADTLNGGTGQNKLVGDAGNDTYVFDTSTSTIFDKSGIDLIKSGISVNLGLYRTIENVTLFGSTACNAIGNALGNVLIGNDFANILAGGLGRDVLKGGMGRDIFDFNSVADSKATTTGRDYILDFNKGEDKIDLRNIDANTKRAGDQAFTFSKLETFTKVAGQLHVRYDYRYASDIVEGDTDGNGVADFQIQIKNYKFMSASDFYL